MIENYPILSKEDIWELCLNMSERDAPSPDFRKELLCFESVFYGICEQQQQEHNRVKNKYYRTSSNKGIVNPLYLDHYAKLMYFFSRELFLKGVNRFLLDQIFLSIKGRCCVDLYYELNLKEYFLPLHAVGTILGRADYGRYFVVEQNCTVGNNKGIYPSFGDGVVLRPNSFVLGNSKIGKNVQVAAGALVIDTDIPDNSVVLGRVPDLRIRENKVDNISLFFD